VIAGYSRVVHPLAAAIAVGDALTAGLSIAVAIALYRIAGRLGYEALDWAASGFAFLALSGGFGVAMVLPSTPRTAAALYTGNAAASAVALTLLAAAPSRGRPDVGEAAMIAPIALVPAGLDAIAAVSGSIAALRGRGAARLGFILLALAHLLRAASVILAPALGRPPVPLAVSETLRASAAALMLGYYAPGGALACRGRGGVG
jgi:hypothetical protein